MDYTEKVFSQEACQVGDRSLVYLTKSEVLRGSRADYIEAEDIGNDPGGQEQKRYLAEAFPEGFVLRQCNNITTWVSKDEVISSEQPYWQADTFDKPCFLGARMLDDTHYDVQIRLPAFAAYKIFHTVCTTGPMQRSRTDRPTTFYFCEGRDKPFNNLDLLPHGELRRMKFSAAQSRTGSAQSYIIKHFSDAKIGSLARAFNKAMRYRCQDYSYFMARFPERPVFSTAADYKDQIDNAEFRRYLAKACEEEERLWIESSDGSGYESMENYDSEDMESDLGSDENDGSESMPDYEDMDHKCEVKSGSDMERDSLDEQGTAMKREDDCMISHLLE